VATAPDVTVAGMYAELLRRAGVRTLVQPQGPGYGGWGAAGALPHRILVTPNLYETAQALLADAFGDEVLAAPRDADRP